MVGSDRCTLPAVWSGREGGGDDEGDGDHGRGAKALASQPPSASTPCS